MTERFTGIINTYKLAKRLRKNYKNGEKGCEGESSFDSKSRVAKALAEDVLNNNPDFKYSVDPCGEYQIQEF